MPRLIILFFCMLISSVCAAKLNLERLLKDDWLQVSSENFVVVTDADKKLAKLLVKDLEHFRYFITETLEINLLPTKPLKIIAISSRRNFKHLDLPELWGGVFYSTIHGDIAVANISGYSKSAKNKSWGNQVLMHEYVHFVTRNTLESFIYPLWYEEGLAEYFASFRIEENGRYVSIGSLDVLGDRLHALQRPGGGKFELVDVEDLFKTTDIKTNWRRKEKGKTKNRGKKSSRKFYARAMLTYHYLTSSPELDSKKTSYLAHINQGKSVDEAFSRSFNMSYAELDDAIYNYVSNDQLKYIRYNTKTKGIDFPEVNPSIERLSTPDIYGELLDVLLKFDSYSLLEKDQSISLRGAYAPESVKAKVSEIAYLAKSVEGYKTLPQYKLISLNKEQLKVLSKFERLYDPLSYEEASEALDDILKVDEKSADALSLKAYLLLQPTLNQLQVGHPQAKKNLRSVRNLARKALRIDNTNTRAFYVLGLASADSAETKKKFLNESAIALESVRLMVGLENLGSKLWSELEVNILMGNSPRVLQLARHYRTLRDHAWITKGYGRFFVEAHEARAGALGETRHVSVDKIQYVDGTIYEGEIKDKLPHGNGVLRTYFGTSMEGQWQNGFLQGKGRLKTSNGYWYTGQFKNGHVSGRGTLEWPAGKYIQKSQGKFLMALEHGEHRFFHADGREVTGSYWLGRAHGKTHVYRDGAELSRYHSYLGKTRYQISEDLIFAGPTNKDNTPDGVGVCYEKSENKLWKCRFIRGEIDPSYTKTIKAILDELG